MSGEWMAKAIERCKDNPSDCCANCVSFRRAGWDFTDDHCKDMASPWPMEPVGSDWWCPQHERKKT